MTQDTPSSRLGSINDLLLYRLGRMSSHAGSMVVRLCEGGFGITRREWGVIGHLREQGPLNPSALAERFELDRATTSRMITSLVGKGLVVRGMVTGNRRHAVLDLTPKGIDLYDALMPQVQAINRKILEALSEAEKAQLDGFIRRLHQSVEELRLVLDTDLPRTHRRLGMRRT